MLGCSIQPEETLHDNTTTQFWFPRLLFPRLLLMAGLSRLPITRAISVFILGHAHYRLTRRIRDGTIGMMEYITYWCFCCFSSNRLVDGYMFDIAPVGLKGLIVWWIFYTRIILQDGSNINLLCERLDVVE